MVASDMGKLVPAGNIADRKYFFVGGAKARVNVDALGSELNPGFFLNQDCLNEVACPPR